MTPEALQDFALKLAAVADMLDQRSTQAAQSAAQGAQQLQSVAQTLVQPEPNVSGGRCRSTDLVSRICRLLKTLTKMVCRG